MGRRKIDIEPITNERNRTVTFIKRKAGLFKKAHELAVLCNVDIAVIILGTNKQFYEYSSVETDQLINTYHRKDLQHHVKDPKDYGDGFVKKKFIDVESSPGKLKNRKSKKNEANSQKNKSGLDRETNRELSNHVDEEEDEEEEDDEVGEENQEEQEEEFPKEGHEDEEHNGEITEYTLDQLGAFGKKHTKRQASQLQEKGANKKRKLSNPNSYDKSSSKTAKILDADEQETVVKTKSNIKSSNKTQNKKQLRIKTGEKKLDSKMVQQFQQMYSTTLSKSNDSTPNQQRHTVPPAASSMPSFPSATVVVPHNNPAYLGSQTVTVPAYQQSQQPYQTLSGYSGKPFLYPGSASANTATSLRTGSLNMTNNDTKNIESDESKGNSFVLNNANSNSLASRLESSSFLTNSGMLRANRTPTTPALLIGGDSLMSRPFGKGNILTPTQTTTTNFGGSNDAATGGNESNKKPNASKLKKQSNLHHSSRPQLRVEIPNTGREVQSSDASATTESQGVSGTVVDSNTSLNEHTTTTENINAQGAHAADVNVGTTNRHYPGTDYGASVNGALHKTPVSSALPSPLLFDSAAKLPNVSGIPFSAKQQSFINAANTRVRGSNFFSMSGQNGNNTGNSAFPISAGNSSMPTNYIPQSAMISPSFQQYFATPLVGPGAYANSGPNNATASINSSDVTNTQAGNVAGANSEDRTSKKQTHSKKPSLTVNTSSTSLDNTSFTNSEGQPLSATTRTLIGDQSFSERPNIKTNNTKTSGSFQTNKDFDSANPYAFKPQLPNINTAMDARSANVPTSGANPDTINADQNGSSLNVNGGGLSAVFSPMNYLFQDWGQPPSALPSNTGFPTAQTNTLSGLLHNNRNNGQDATKTGNASSQNAELNASDTRKDTQKASGADDFVFSKDAPNRGSNYTGKENNE